MHFQESTDSVDFINQHKTDSLKCGSVVSYSTKLMEHEAVGTRMNETPAFPDLKELPTIKISSESTTKTKRWLVVYHKRV